MPPASLPAIPAARPRLGASSVGVLLVLVSACAFGSGALFAKPVYALGVDWVALLYWRFLLAAGVTWACVLALPRPRRALRELRPRRALAFVLLGVVYVGNTATYFAALETIPASLNVLITYLYPVLVAVLSIRFGRRLTGRTSWIALGIASLGVALTVGGVDFGHGGGPPISGVVLAFASPCIYAVWIVLQARVAGERPDAARAADARAVPPADAEVVAPPDAAPTDPTVATALMTSGTFVIYLIIALLTGHSIDPRSVPSGAGVGLLGIGIVSGAIAMLGFYAGAQRIGAARAALISTVEPIYLVVLAMILFGERLTPVQLLGGGLVLGAVLMTQRAGLSRASRALVAPRTGRGLKTAESER